jgi:8-oxo-dGTP pyrophosphatase MutT (NUDIX family)
LWRHDGKQKRLRSDLDGTPGVSLVEALRGRLLQEPPQVRSPDDSDLAPELRSGAFDGVKAAVLLPIVAREDPTLLFTRRTETLARHSGQISFPGGRSEERDGSPAQTALRETLEETGIEARFITMVGYLDRYLTGTGFDIQPVVSVLAEGFVLAPDPREVASVFEVPLGFLLDPANQRRETRSIAGRERRFHAITYEDHEIWGATAAIIVDLASRLDGISLRHEN